MTTFYLIRHAEAEGNLYRRMHGQRNSMITPYGMKQIYALADRFRDIPVDLCFTSDLLRTKTTAQAICIPKGLRMIEEPAFRELDVGCWDDLTFGYLQTFEPISLEQFGKQPGIWSVEGSEPFASYTGRFIAAMIKIAEDHPGKTVAVFSHAAVMRGVIMTLFPETVILPSDNTCVSKLTYEDGRFRLLYQNDTGHLSPDISTASRNRSMGDGFERSDNLFWYCPGLPEMEELQAPASEITYTVMAGQKTAGILCLSTHDKTGVIDYMGLRSHWRGRGRSVQLLGEAIFTFRELGMETLIFKKPSNGALDDLCHRMEFQADCDGICRMDLSPRVLPFDLCTAGEPAVAYRPPIMPAPEV